METKSARGNSGNLTLSVKERLSGFVNDHIVLCLLGPALVLILGIFLYPVLWMFYKSLFLTAPGLEEQFQPLYNYQRMFTSSQFWEFLEHTLFYSFGSLALSFGIGLIIALALNHIERKRVRSVYTTVILFSWALPLAVAALMWKWIMQPGRHGLLNNFLLDIGIVADPLPLLSGGSALAIVTAVDAWIRIPFAMIVFLAGLQSIPEHMYDAAKVDGATTFQSFRNITLPYLRPYMAIVGLINWMFAFRAFSLIFPMTEGGPGNDTMTLALYIYREGMVKLDFGYGSAIAAFLVGVTVILAIFYVTQVLKRIEE